MAIGYPLFILQHNEIMEIADTLKKKPKVVLGRWLTFGALTVLFLISWWAFSSVQHQESVDKSSLRISAVKRAALKVKVDGYGRLRAKHQRLLTAQTQSIVESILLYPGAKVLKDSIILTLSNPDLEQDVATARLELAQQNAQLKEQVIAHQSQLLERESQITLLKSQLENAQLRVEAEGQLVAKGIVSVLDFKQTQLDVRQLEQRVTIEYQRLVQLKAMHQQREQIATDLVAQYQLNYKSVLNRLEQLNVRAGLDGVLQSLPVEIGQSVAPGTQLAMVGSDKQLVAELRVQQRLADQINLDMAGEIRTFGNAIKAKVTRIDPVVTDGRVMVELELQGQLPANARPDLTVEGHVNIKEIKNALVVEQPSDIHSFDNKKVYKISADGSRAQLTAIEFGTLSDNNIEVISGAKVGDNIIVSDMSQWLSSSSIQLDD